MGDPVTARSVLPRAFAPALEVAAAVAPAAREVLVVAWWGAIRMTCRHRFGTRSWYDLGGSRQLLPPPSQDDGRDSLRAEPLQEGREDERHQCRDCDHDPAGIPSPWPTGALRSRPCGGPGAARGTGSRKVASRRLAR